MIHQSRNGQGTFYSDILLRDKEGHTYQGSVQKGKLHGVPDVPVLCLDNNTALIVARNPEQHKKAKHIDIKYSKVRDEYEAVTYNLRA